MFKFLIEPGIIAIGGQLNQSIPGEESDLDMQFGLGLSFPTPGIFYSTGGSPPFNREFAFNWMVVRSTDTPLYHSR